MNNMYINNTPYWFSEDGVANAERLYNAKYVGAWCTKRPSGGWNEQPVDVFYVENPDTSKGHTNYFGLFRRGDAVIIVDASSAFDADITGVLCEDGEVLVSRYRHDCVNKKGQMIDGGRDYVRSATPTTFVDVFMNDGKFTFRKVEM